MEISPEAVYWSRAIKSPELSDEVGAVSATKVFRVEAGEHPERRNTASPSSIVSFQASSESPRLYEAPKVYHQLRRSDSSTENQYPAIEKMLEQSLNISDRSAWGSALSALGALVEEGASEYRQTFELSRSSGRKLESELSPLKRATSDVTQHASFRLTVTTTSGKEVDFTFALKSGNALSETDGSYQYDELDVTYRASDALSASEKEALSEFAGQLQVFTGDFFSSPDKGPRLSGLGLFEHDQIKGVELKLDGADATLRLSATETGENRRLKLSWQTQLSAWADGTKVGRSRNELQLIINKAGTLNIEGIRKDQALESQKAIIDEQLSQGKSKTVQKNFVLDAFDSAHRGLSFHPADGIPGASSVLTTGLADYELKFEGEMEMPMQSAAVLNNPPGRTAEGLRGNENSRLAEGIELFELQQKTRRTSHKGTETIEQTQRMVMQASYFEALAHLQHPDFHHQNFKHHQIDNSYEITARQSIKDGALLEAVIRQDKAFSHSVTEYSEGKVIDQISRDSQQSQLLDVLMPLLSADIVNEENIDAAIRPHILAHKTFP